MHLGPEKTTSSAPRITACALAFAALFVGCARGATATGRTFAPGSGFWIPGEKARLTSKNQAEFEAGNVGKAERTGPASFDISLRSDNDDALPAYWRNWYYFKLPDVPVGTSVTLTIRGEGIGNRYVPAFSYEPRPDLRDQDNAWQLFRDAEVSQPAPLTVKITTTFSNKTVWIARWHPYSYSRLIGFLGKIRGKPGVELGSLGHSPAGHDVPFVSVTDRHVAAAFKQRIFIHARTHPGEVGSNFLLEGLLRFASGAGPEAKRFRAKSVLDVVPMVNVDGVIAGNNRVTPTGVNLEGKWYPDPAGLAAQKKCETLDPERAPPEVILLNAFYRDRPRDGANVAMALNLHASAGEPDDHVFFFPHFGPHSSGFSLAEANLNRKQMIFIDVWRRLQGAAWFNPPQAASRGIENRNLPESWWWRTKKNRVMAMTIESVYGHAAGSSRWMTPDDMREMGLNLGRALLVYLENREIKSDLKSTRDLTSN